MGLDIGYWLDKMINLFLVILNLKYVCDFFLVNVWFLFS